MKGQENACKIEREDQNAERTRAGMVYSPLIDIEEGTEELVLRADLPGAKGDEIDIRFEDGELKIHAPVADRAVEGARPIWSEYGVGDFQRSFKIGEGIDASRIRASFARGTLTLALPKVEALRPRKITVAVD